MPDGTNEGLHGFLVPIRDNKLQVLDNVQIWDLGHKIGLNGIDNAALWFNNVRIPKDNLLDATSQIDDTGDYQSSISDNSKRKRKRFIVLADQLLSGRICIASMTLGSTKMTLDTTIRYAHNRLTVGKDGFSNTPIMNYQLQMNNRKCKLHGCSVQHGISNTQNVGKDAVRKVKLTVQTQQINTGKPKAH